MWQKNETYPLKFGEARIGYFFVQFLSRRLLDQVGNQICQKTILRVKKKAKKLSSYGMFDLSFRKGTQSCKLVLFSPEKSRYLLR
jgi:hypothetical protein